MQDKGFTLIEVLLTLTIIICLSAISLPVFSHQIHLSIDEQTKLVCSSISEARSYSLINHQVVHLAFSTHELHIYSENKALDKKLKLDEQYNYDDLKEIYYNKNGNINQANHILICGHNEVKKIIFNLGSGAFYVQ